jgi:hypothetical protein
MQALCKGHFYNAATAQATRKIAARVRVDGRDSLPQGQALPNAAPAPGEQLH